MIHSILIIGQSNMAGRGLPSEAPALNNLDGRIKVLRNGRWFDAYRPMNPDRSTAGVCLAESFAAKYALDRPEVTVGVIPCADGGTSISQWEEGSLLFDNAVNCARLAMRTSNLAAILWHQGEADCGDSKRPLYLERLSKMLKALKRAIGAEEVPVVVGGLGDFLFDREESPALKNYGKLNEILKGYADTEERVAFASAKGLTGNPDNLHFSAKSLLAFGERYYEAFLSVEDKTRVFEEKSDMDSAIRSEMELL